MHATLTYNEPRAVEGELSRRALLKSVGLALASGALMKAGAAWTETHGEAVAQPVLALQRATFAALHGHAFQVDVGGAPLALHLTDVRDLHASSANHEQRFALWFRGPAEQPLEQNTYTFTHHNMGSVPLFIVPMQQNDDGSFYEAIFNNK